MIGQPRRPDSLTTTSAPCALHRLIFLRVEQRLMSKAVATEGTVVPVASAFSMFRSRARILATAAFPENWGASLGLHLKHQPRLIMPVVSSMAPHSPAQALTAIVWSLGRGWASMGSPHAGALSGRAADSHSSPDAFGDGSSSSSGLTSLRILA